MYISGAADGTATSSSRNPPHTSSQAEGISSRDDNGRSQNIEKKYFNLRYFAGANRSTSDDDTPATRRQRLDSDFVDFDFD